MIPKEIIAKDKIKDVAKGRFDYHQVNDLLESIYKDGFMDGMKATDKRVVEAMIYLVAQELHYFRGFGKQRLDAIFNDGLAERLQAIYAGAFDVSEVKQALKDDTGWEWNVVWRD